MNFRQGALVLSKTDPNGLYPVWRLATTKPGAGTGIANGSNVQAHFQQHPDSSILQPQVLGQGITTPNPMYLETNIWNNYVQAWAVSPNIGATPAQAFSARLNTNIDRVAYFTNQNCKFTTGSAYPGQNDFFYQLPPAALPGLPATITPAGPSTTGQPVMPSPNNIFLQPGCYAVVGPYRGPNSEAKVTASNPSTNNVTFIGYVNTTTAAAAPPSKTCTSTSICSRRPSRQRSPIWSFRALITPRQASAARTPRIRTRIRPQP